MTSCKKHCPGCHQQYTWGGKSKFGHGRICSDCKQREALTGDFIKFNREHAAKSLVTA